MSYSGHMWIKVSGEEGGSVPRGSTGPQYLGASGSAPWEDTPDWERDSAAAVCEHVRTFIEATRVISGVNCRDISDDDSHGPDSLDGLLARAVRSLTWARHVVPVVSARWPAGALRRSGAGLRRGQRRAPAGVLVRHMRNQARRSARDVAGHRPLGRLPGALTLSAPDSCYPSVAGWPHTLCCAGLREEPTRGRDLERGGPH
jgi:hypothetical protein